MSVQVKRRREAASFLSTFTGAAAELIVDTTNNRVQVHDGVTAGGWPAAKLSEVVTNTRTTIADAAYSALASDRLVAFTALTAARIVTLPAASAYPTGTPLRIVDESGACSVIDTITINAAGTDTINGAASATLSMAYAYASFESDGAGKWTVVDQRAFDAVSTAGILAYSGTVVVKSNSSYQPLPANTLVAVVGANGEQGRMVFDGYLDGVSGNPPNFIFRAAEGTSTSPSALLAGDTLGQFSWFGYGTTGYSVSARAQVKAAATQNWTDTEQGAAITFLVTPNNTSAPFEAGRFDNTGYLGIGTTTPQQPLDVAGTIQAHAPNGSNFQLCLTETLVTLSGASTDAPIGIPANCIVFSVAAYVVEAITGAPSYDVGVLGNTSQFGGSLGVAAGSSNFGLIGPEPIYSATPLVITATSGSFTGGQVRLAIHYMQMGGPTS